MKKPASLKFAAVRHATFASPAATVHARMALAMALGALLAPWRARPAWFALMLVLLYWFFWW